MPELGWPESEDEIIEWLEKLYEYRRQHRTGTERQLEMLGRAVNMLRHIVIDGGR